MFIAASYGMRRAEVIAPDIHDIVNHDRHKPKGF